ncbi:conserved protein of unknown function precursor containing a type A C-terminal secretion signal [Tenacibaculum sp. 190130A14a]|uniref:Por_Secre_tail domain-containing protein n=1 Tax=Tenacibaculum polynesiense TaxID=3137857 RepID=A0ABM9P8S4_9FLAO
MKIKTTTVVIKPLCVLLLLFLVNGKLCAQNNNGTIDAAGDIAIVAFNKLTSPTSKSDYAFLLLDDCTAGTSIIFDDEEWTGAGFNSQTSEGNNTWTNSTGSTISAGTVIQVSSGNDSPTANIGAVVETNGGFNLAAGDQLFAYLGTTTGTTRSATTFLTFYGGFGSTPPLATLSGTGLTDGSTAIVTSNLGYYSGSTTCNSSLGDCAAMINNPANWTTGAFTFPTGVPTSFNGTAFSDVATWSGASSNDWNNVANWSTGAVPTSGTDVTIPNGLTNYPTISSSVTVNSISIASGASLIATASVTGPTTYTRSIGTTNWYLVSSPVSGESITDLRTNNNFASGSVAGRIGLAPYDNTQAAGSRWIYQTTSSSGTLNNGQGYSIKLAAAGNLAFTGTVHNSNVTRSISIGTTGFNLVGNPFTAFLNSGTGGFLPDNSGLLTSQTLWVWNQATGSYETKVTADDFKIAPGQAFFVECGTGGSVTFQTADLSHETTDTFQKSNSKSEIHLNISANKETSKTKFYFIDGTTKGFDNGYDGKMFSGTTNNFAVYSQLVSDNDGVNYAIQSLPKNDMNRSVIPVGLNAKAGKEIEFSITSENLSDTFYVYLEDRKNNEFTNLSDTSYKITLNEDANGIGQFYLHITSLKLDAPLDLSTIDVSVYKSAPNTLTIVGVQQNKASLKVYSILGKEVIRKDFDSDGVSTLDIPSLTTGVYVVEINSNKGKTTKKIILD